MKPQESRVWVQASGSPNYVNMTIKNPTPKTCVVFFGFTRDGGRGVGGPNKKLGLWGRTRSCSS